MTIERFDESLPDALDGQRVDRVVAMMADVSRKLAAELIAERRVLVDGVPAEKPSLKVMAGAAITFEVDQVSGAIEPDPSVEVNVVYLDDDVIVVDKPAGLIVHPGSGVRGATLANGLLALHPELSRVGEPDRPGIVHRLDKGTAGLLMVARTEAAYRSLTRQLKRRTVDRRYRTLVAGHVESDGGVIDAPLGRSARDATRRAIVADGRPARTHYEVVERLVARPDDAVPAPDFESAGVGDGLDEVEAGAATDPGLRLTLLICRLETGRTHQIRAHLSAIGHPVVGDTNYGGPAEIPGFGRLDHPFLHAEALGFEHPTTGQHLAFAAETPPDLQSVLAVLESAGP